MSKYLCALLLFVCAAPLAAQPYALARLEQSPRHLEWTTLDASDGRTLHAFVAWPERRADALAVIGSSTRTTGSPTGCAAFADQLAEAGFVAIAPRPALGHRRRSAARTRDFASEDAAREAISTPRARAGDGATSTRSPQSWAAKLPGRQRQGRGGPASAGAARRRSASRRGAPDLAGLRVLRHCADDNAALARIAVPVYGFYGGNDARVNATIAATRSAMKALEQNLRAGHLRRRRPRLHARRRRSGRGARAARGTRCRLRPPHGAAGQGEMKIGTCARALLCATLAASPTALAQVRAEADPGAARRCASSFPDCRSGSPSTRKDPPAAPCSCSRIGPW